MLRCARLVGPVLGSVLLLAGSAAADVTITIDPATQYQTILGWGANSGLDDVPEFLREQIIDTAVNDYGLTRLRLEPPAGNNNRDRRWEWDNDDGDPDTINWSAFNTAGWDKRIRDWVLPFKQKVEANGDPFSLYVSPSFFDGGSSGTAPAWLLHSAGEYAEYATSLLLYLKNQHGIVADHYCILNEAGNDNAWTVWVVSWMIKTLGPRLQALGLPTRIQFPECMNANGTWTYIQAVQNDPDIWPYIGLLSYHLYGNNTNRPSIRDFALARGLPTAMTEYMNITTQHLYEDLTLGGVSYWETYGYHNRQGNEIQFNNDYTQITSLGGGEYWWLRQTIQYVRPGAVRIGCTPSNSSLRAVAFSKAGKVVVVLNNNVNPMISAQNAIITGLPPGQYGVSETYGDSVIYNELGIQTVLDDGVLTVPLRYRSVLTVYPYPGTNMPPVVTSWKSVPNYLTAPASTTTLSAAAVDPERATLSYTWSVTSQPAGANVVLATPNASSCAASGLTAVGTYTFRVTISDGINNVIRNLMLKVHAGNEPPVVAWVHNRNPVQVFTTGAATQLRVDAYDLENDPLTYSWSVVSQPAGAKAVIASPTAANTTVTGLNKAGIYVFRISVSDPTHTTTQDLEVPVDTDLYAPLITNASAAPSSPRAGQSVELSATTSDPDGDIITHWWQVVTVPSSDAKPVFNTPGRATATVTGLTEPGTYTFRLAAIDKTHVTTKDVTVTVGPRLLGDIDGDGHVNVFDIFMIAESWNTQIGDPLYNPDADLDDDGAVNVFDIFVLAENWGQ